VSEPLAPAVSLAVLRDALRRAVDQTSLRQVAREVGLSPRGVTLVIRGVQSQKKTVAKLREWYARHGPAVVGMSGEMAAASLANLLEGLDGADREVAARAIVALLEAVHRGREADPPGWIDHLRSRRV
jgi:hypothetical protein